MSEEHKCLLSLAALSSSELMCYALSSNFLPITNGSIWTHRNVALLKSVESIALNVRIHLGLAQAVHMLFSSNVWHQKQ